MTTLAWLANEAAQTLWPASCAACERPVAEETLFCGACNLSINPLVGVCPGCALPTDDGRSGPWVATPRCRTCRRVPFPFTDATAGFEYGEALAEAIVRMKHGGRRHLGRRLARLLVQPLAEALSRGSFTSTDAVIAVPLHSHKLRARGFNQALELARWALFGPVAGAGVAALPGFAPGSILHIGPVIHHGTPQFLAYHPGYVAHNFCEIRFQVPNMQKHVLYAALGPKD